MARSCRSSIRACPMRALNGIMLIAWSAALIFAILRRAVPDVERR